MEQHPSPNQGPRRSGFDAPDTIVIHYTAMAGGPAGAIRHLCTPEAQVSAHYVLGEDGCAVQLVDDSCRAWHAGAGRWGASDDVNSRSIGIELSNDGASPFPEAQMARLESLLADLMTRHQIAPQMVIGHSCCAPGRKIDPGERFDWRRLALGGLAIWPGLGAAHPGPHRWATPDADADRFQADLARGGRTADAHPDVLLEAFRLRFRPGATGPLSPDDCAVAAEIADRFPVDPPPAGA